MSTASKLGLQPGTYTIDATHSSVEFSVRHLVVSKVRGGFDKYSGTVVVSEDLASASAEVEIDVASVNTKEASRDGHLKSPDFFDAEAFPTILFKTTNIVPGDKSHSVTGDLTIKGVTHPVVLDVEFNGAGADPYGGYRAGFSATTKISRKEFALTWNAMLETGGAVVGDEITVQLEVELVKAS